MGSLGIIPCTNWCCESCPATEDMLDGLPTPDIKLSPHFSAAFPDKTNAERLLRWDTCMMYVFQEEWVGKL